MNENEPIGKCYKCKIIKPKHFFYKFKYNHKFCKKCHIKSYIKDCLIEAYIANHFNLSIDELKYIMTIDDNDPIKDEAGEHNRFDEIFPYYSIAENSTIITDNIINNYLDEVL